MYIDYSRQGMFCIGAALYRDPEYRFSLLNGDVQVAVVVGHHARRAALLELRLTVRQALHRLVPAHARALLRPRPHAALFLHVEASRQLMGQLLQQLQYTSKHNHHHT